MRIVNTITKESFPVRDHANNKKPSYFDEAARSKSVTIDGEETKMVLRPNSTTSNRVNFQKGDKYFYVDNDTLHALIDAKGGPKLRFETTTERAVKQAAPAAEEAKEAEVATA